MGQLRMGKGLRSIGASKEPTVAVIGCGYWGKNLVRNFAQLGALRMVCDVDEVGRKLAAEMAPHAEVVADVDQVLNAPEEGARALVEIHEELLPHSLEVEETYRKLREGAEGQGAWELKSTGAWGRRSAGGD